VNVVGLASSPRSAVDGRHVQDIVRRRRRFARHADGRIEKEIKHVFDVKLP
jgi:hypothetical protein